MSLFGIISPRPEKPTIVPYSLADVVLERLSVAFVLLQAPWNDADAGHAVAAADLDVIAAREILVLACPTATTGCRRACRRCRRRHGAASFERGNVPLRP